MQGGASARTAAYWVVREERTRSDNDADGPFSTAVRYADLAQRTPASAKLISGSIRNRCALR